MKNWYITLTLLLFSSGMFAQSEADFGKIALSVVMPDNVEGLDATQLSKLQTKITQIVTASGLAASGFDQNFVIYPTFAIYDNTVVESGMQDITILNCDLALFVKDYENNVIFSTINKSLKGTGKSKPQAITSAISKLNINDPDFAVFLNTAKSKIIDYFNAKCEIMIQNAFSLVEQEKFDEALYKLTLVPDVCEDCYFKCLDTMGYIYTQKINAECDAKLQEASVIWSTAPNQQGAEKAAEIISTISPLADCQEDVEVLIKSINEKLLADDKKNWDFMMKQYQDKLDAERAKWLFEVKQYNDELEAEKERDAFEREKYEDRLAAEKERDAFEREKYEDRLAAEKERDAFERQKHKDQMVVERQRASSQSTRTTANTGSSANASTSTGNNQSRARSSQSEGWNISHLFKSRSTKRNSNLDKLRLREYRNAGVAHAQGRPKRLSYSAVSRR